MPDQLFGTLGAFSDIEEDLIAHVKLWLPTYLAARERKKGITPGSIARPRSWIARQRFEALPGEDSTPAIIVVSAGTVDTPRRHGTGAYDAELGAAVVALCHGPEATSARALAGHYQAAIMTLLLQQSKFNGAAILTWEGISLEDVPEEQVRTLCAARMEFTIMVPNFITANPHLSPPPPTPPNDYDPQPDDPVVLDPGTITQPME